MLKNKVNEKIKPTKKILELFNQDNLKINNGYIQIIEKINIKQVFPIVYKLILFEFPKEYSRKEFYLLNENKSIDLMEFIVKKYYMILKSQKKE